MAISALHSELTGELCVLLQKAYRAVRFYPADHPLAGEAVESLFRAFGERLDYYPLLHLQVREDSLVEDGAVVYHQPEIRESLLFLLFRDGVREISFHHGLTRHEIQSLLSAITNAEGPSAGVNDLACALWEQDFAHITYTLVDPLLESEGGQAGLTALRERLAGSLEGLSQTLEGGSSIGYDPHSLLQINRPTAALEPLPSSGLLSQNDVRAIEQLVAEEEDDRVLDDFALVLGEVLAGARSEEEVRAAAHALQELLASFLKWGQTERLAASVASLVELGRKTGPRARDISEVLKELAGSEGLRRLLLSLDYEQGISVETVQRLLVLLTPYSYPVMVDCLISAGKASRKCLLNTLMAGDGPPLSLITPHLNDSRWYVVRNMVYLLGRSKDPASLEFLQRALEHSDERVRREAVRSLCSTGTESVAPLVLSRLDDPASSVRAAAAHQAPSLSGCDVTAALLRRISSRDFPSRPHNEAVSFLDALARLADDRAVPALTDLWRNRGLFRARPLELRLEAVKALGAIGTDPAREGLALAARSGEKPIRELAARLLTEPRTPWNS